jgi:SAM-dependent methyltransferase
LGQPLRPGEDDVARVQASIDELAPTDGQATTALILGVTPELVHRRWPPTATVLATDLSMVMINGVGPAAGTGRRPTAAQADWLALPLSCSSCDLVLSDAGFANVPVTSAAALAGSIRRVLRNDGALTTRMFVRPEEDEEPDEVWEELVDRRIGTFAAFKLRLLMALCGEDGDVGVEAAWDHFATRCADIDALAVHLGWPAAEVRTIEAYRGQTAAYWFPTLAQFRAVVSREFDEQACHWPDYELGERCPTFVLR